MRFDKVIAKIIKVQFFGLTVYNPPIMYSYMAIMSTKCEMLRNNFTLFSKIIL